VRITTANNSNHQKICICNHRPAITFICRHFEIPHTFGFHWRFNLHKPHRNQKQTFRRHCKRIIHILHIIFCFSIATQYN